MSCFIVFSQSFRLRLYFWLGLLASLEGKVYVSSAIEHHAFWNPRESDAGMPFVLRAEKGLTTVCEPEKALASIHHETLQRRTQAWNPLSLLHYFG